MARRRRPRRLTKHSRARFLRHKPPNVVGAKVSFVGADKTVNLGATRQRASASEGWRSLHPTSGSNSTRFCRCRVKHSRARFLTYNPPNVVSAKVRFTSAPTQTVNVEASHQRVSAEGWHATGLARPIRRGFCRRHDETFACQVPKVLLVSLYFNLGSTRTTAGASVIAYEGLRY